MKVGVPREIKTHEYRVGLTPGAVREYVAAGHSVLVETNAGAGIGATDDNYRKAGATIVASGRELFATSEMIIKVKEPSRPSGPSCEKARSFSLICIWRQIRSRPKDSSNLGAPQSLTKR